MLVATGVYQPWEDTLVKTGWGSHSWSRLPSLQVHCGQLSDSEEQSLQVVEKHVSWVGPLPELVGKTTWPESWTGLASGSSLTATSKSVSHLKMR